jgi:hypothetical protein
MEIPMAETTTTTTAAAAVQQAASMTVDLFGWQVNLMGMAVALAVLGILFLFYRIQKSDKLDFADMITKDGKAVSLTKVLQLIGGMSATWVIIKLTLTGGLTEAIFGLYLTYVGAIEGYSKFVAAKYGYNEKSIKDAKAAVVDSDAADPSLKPPKV